MLATQTVDASEWWSRPRGQETDAWIGRYQQSVKGRQRDAISRAVDMISPSTLLEVGCHCGPNLIRLGKDHQHLRMLGFDVSKEAIDAGKSWVNAEGMSGRIQLNVGRLPDALDALPTGSVDVALSSYVLAYIAPRDLDATLYELGRVATRGVVLCEPQKQTATARHTLSGYQEWTHDYRARHGWIGTLRDMLIEEIQIDPPVDSLTGVLIFSNDFVSGSHGQNRMP